MKYVISMVLGLSLISQSAFAVGGPGVTRVQLPVGKGSVPAHGTPTGSSLGSYRMPIPQTPAKPNAPAGYIQKIEDSARRANQQSGPYHAGTVSGRANDMNRNAHAINAEIGRGVINSTIPKSSPSKH